MEDTSPIVIGWAIGQDNIEEKRFAIRFGAKILIEKQRTYLEVKRDLLRVFITLNAKKNYLMRTSMVLEKKLLLLLKIIINYTISKLPY